MKPVPLDGSEIHDLVRYLRKEEAQRPPHFKREKTIVV